MCSESGVVGEWCLEWCRAGSSHPLYSLLHYLSLVSAEVGKAGEAGEAGEAENVEELMKRGYSL